MRLFKKKISVQNDNWEYWDFYDEDEFYGLDFIDKTYFATESQKGFNKEYYLKILFPEYKTVEGNFPAPEAHQEIQILEDGLVLELEKAIVNCKQVYRSTYFGAKRLLFEVSDSEAFEKTVANWKKSLDEFQLELLEEKAWTMYNQLMPDKYANQQIGDRRLIEALVNGGSNPELVHSIEHAFYGGLKNLLKVEKELHKEGGTTSFFENESLGIIFNSVLDLDEINAMTYFLMDKAEECDCKYDGWLTAIRK